MQLAAWNYGVGSGIFTGIEQDKLRKDFGIPQQLNVSAIIGFGYPQKKLTGNRKERLLIHKLVYYEKYGTSNRA
jgi:nitroreductase